MVARENKVSWCVVVFTLFAAYLTACGGGTSNGPGRIPFQLYGMLCVEDVAIPETLSEGLPLELQITVNMPDDQGWIGRAENERGRKVVFIDVDVINEETSQYRIRFHGIRFVWPDEPSEWNAINSPPYTHFVWHFPEDFRVQGRYADGEHFDGAPLLEPGTYEVWMLSGNPPIGSLDDWSQELFGSFEVVPAEDGGS